MDLYFTVTLYIYISNIHFHISTIQIRAYISNMHLYIFTTLYIYNCNVHFYISITLYMYISNMHFYIPAILYIHASNMHFYISLKLKYTSVIVFISTHTHTHYIYIYIQSTLVISNSKPPPEILRDIRTSTYQICRIEEKIIRTTTFNKYICVIGHLKLEIYWKYCGKEEKWLLRSHLGAISPLFHKILYLLLDFHA